MTRLRFPVALAAVAALAAVLGGTAGAALTPAQLFAQVDSGMLFVRSACASGEYTGSGFLVGPQTMVTALHVIEDEDGSACSVVVIQEETDAKATMATFSAWTVDSGDDKAIVDLAVVALDRPLTGYTFSLASVSPTVGERIIGLGYSLGNAISMNQGSVASLTAVGKAPAFKLNLLGAKGSSGGPILNLQGEVVGLTQRGQTSASASLIESLDLPRFLHGSPSTLCDATAQKFPNTLCGTLTASTPDGTTTAAPDAAAASQATPAASTRPLAIGDAIVVKGTRIICFALKSSGKNGVACVLFDKKTQPIKGTYGVGMAVDGTAVLNQITADGSPKILLKRKPQAAARRSDEAYTGVPGDVFLLPISARRKLACKIIDVKPGQAAPLYRGIKIGCWRILKSGFPVPSSDAIQISDGMAAILHGDAKGVFDTTVLVKKQPA